MNILGVKFMEHFYTVYDQEQFRIGFASSKQNGGKIEKKTVASNTMLSEEVPYKLNTPAIIMILIVCLLLKLTFNKSKHTDEAYSKEKDNSTQSNESICV